MLCDLAAWIYKATSISRRELSLLAIVYHHYFGESTSQTRPALESFPAARNFKAVVMDSRAKHRREVTMAEHYKRVPIHCVATLLSNIQIHP
jgi:predicted alpha/beta-fold hydrolase